MRNVKRIWWLFCLCALMAQASPPQPLRAVYRQETRQLTVVFSQPVRTDSAALRLGALRIDDDFGRSNADVTLSGASYPGILPDTMVSIDLAFNAIIDSYTYTSATGLQTALCWGKQTVGLQALETLPNRNQLRLHLSEGFAIGLTNELSTATGDSGIVLSFIDYAAPLQLLSSAYNAQSNQLILTYNRAVKFDVIAEDLMIPSTPPLPGNRILDFGEDRNGNNALDIEPNLHLSDFTISSSSGTVALSGGEVVTLHDTSRLAIQLSVANRRAVEALDVSHLQLSYPLFAVVDTFYRSGAVIDASLMYFPESTVANLDSASYDWGTNKLRLNFSQPLSTTASSIIFGRILIGGSIGGVDTLWALTGGTSTLRDNNYGVEIELSSGDQMNVESLARLFAPMKLVLNRGAVMTAEGNDNLPADVTVREVIETTQNHAPAPVSATYDANVNKLTVVFDLRISDRSGRNDVTVSGFGISDGTHERYLTEGTYRRVNSNSGIEITLSDADEVQLETMINKTGWKFRLLPFSVLQLSRLNGNRAIGGDSVTVTYIADTTAPVLKEVFVNRFESKLKMSFTEAVDPTSLTTGAITVSGVSLSRIQLDTTNRLDTTRSKWVYLKLNASDSIAFYSLSWNQLVNPTVSLAANAIRNFDQAGNPAWTDKVSGDSLYVGTIGSELLAGIGRAFWVKSREAFPSEDQRIDGMLRKIGIAGVVNRDTTELYVDAAMLVPLAKNLDRRPVSRADIDSLWQFYTTRSVADTTKGAYELLEGLVGRGYTNLFPSKKVSILWCDLLDEFNLGRNDTKRDFFIGSYFNSTDQLSSTETTTSTNELDLIFLDAWPQTVLTTDTSNYYDESVSTPIWKLYTTAGQTAYNALSNALSRLMAYKVDRFEAAWQVEGIAQMAELLTTGKTEFYGAARPSTPSDPDSRSLTFVGTGLKIKDDFYNINLFFNYLREQCGGMELMRRLAASRYTGIYALEKTLEESQDIVLSYNRGLKLADLYLNYATAALLDTTNGLDDGRYMIQSANLWGGIISKNGTALKWKPEPANDRPPYKFSLGPWSFSYNFIYWDSDTSTHENPLIDVSTDPLTINTIDGLGFKARCVWIPSELLSTPTDPNFRIMDYTLNSVGAGEVPFAPTINGHAITPGSLPGQMKLLAMVVVKSDERTSFAQGDYIVSNRSTAPDYIKFGVQPDPASDRHLGLWIASSNQLYTSLGVETPEVEVTEVSTQNSSTFSLPRVFSSSTGNEFSYVYTGRTYLSTSGTYRFALNAITEGGVPISTTPIELVADMIPAGGHMNWAGGSIQASRTDRLGFTWSFTENPLTEATGITVSYSAPQGVPVTHIGPDRRLNESVQITLPISEAITESNVAVYREDNGVWCKVGGERNGSSISVRVRKLGRFAVLPATMAAPTADDAGIPIRYSIGDAYPNPFNGAVSLPISLPERSMVRMTVYNVLGQKVYEMPPGALPAGMHRLMWKGEPAAGVYFATITAGEAVRTVKLIRLP